MYILHFGNKNFSERMKKCDKGKVGVEQCQEGQQVLHV